MKKSQIREKQIADYAREQGTRRDAVARMWEARDRKGLSSIIRQKDLRWCGVKKDWDILSVES